MKLIVGIDEAGYGPRLGPLVIASVRLHAPETVNAQELFGILEPTVGRYGREKRLLTVDDSKRLYRFGGDIGRLERPLFSFLAAGKKGPPRNLADLLATTPADLAQRLAPYPWYTAGLAHKDLPLSPQAMDDSCGRALARVLRHAGIQFQEIAVRVLLAGEFNAHIMQTGNKAATHGEAVMGLLERSVRTDHATDAEVIVDRLGGRFYYASLLSSSFPLVPLVIEHEDPKQSHYRINLPEQRLEISFQTGADREFLPVALASMAAKYVREVFVACLNDYFRERLEGLQPTAGYPSDAERFLVQITPILDDIDRDLLIRRR